MDCACFPQPGPPAGIRSGARSVCHPRVMTIDADLDVTCPRCAAEAWPGSTARVRRVATSCGRRWATIGHLAEAVDYEPKMNVTPNAVALKD